MAVSDYNQNTNWENERTYLNNLIAGGGGDAVWAKQQLNDLNAAQQKYSTPTTQTTPANNGNANYYSTGGTTGTVDYSNLINDAIRSGKDADTVRGLVEQRGAKIDADPTLEQYRNDDTYKRALAYIDAQERQNNSPAELQPLYAQNEAIDRATEVEQQDNSLAELQSQLQSLYAQNGALDQAAEAERKAKIAAVEAAIARLNAQKGDVNTSYDAIQRQLYINREKNAKNIQQQMAAAGLTGGAAESTLLGLNTAYEEGLRQGEQERARAIGEIEQGITDTQLTGNLDAAEALANRTKERLDSYAQALQILMQQENVKQQQEKEERAAAQSRAYALALSMLESGMMPSSDMLTTAGIDMGTAQQLKAAADASESVTAGQFEIALNAALNGSTDASVRRIIESYSGLPMETALAAYRYTQNAGTPSYQGTTKVQKPTQGQFELAIAAAARGSTDASVRQIIESYSGLPMETVLAAYGYGAPTANPIGAGSTVSAPSFSDIKRTIVGLCNQGNYEKAQSVLEQYWNSMTAGQQAELTALFS